MQWIVNHTNKSIYTIDQRSLMIRFVCSVVVCLWLPGNWAHWYTIQLMCGHRCVYIGYFIMCLMQSDFTAQISFFIIKAQRCVVGQISGESGLKIVFNYRKLIFSVLFLRTAVSRRAMSPSPACDVISKGKYGDGSCSIHFKHVQILSVVTIFHNKCTKVLTKWQKAAVYP